MIPIELNGWPFPRVASETQMPLSKALGAETLQLRRVVRQHPGMKTCKGLNMERGDAQINFPKKLLLKVDRGSSRFFLDATVVRYLNFSSSYQVTSCEVRRGQGSNCDSCKCQMTCPPLWLSPWFII